MINKKMIDKMLDLSDEKLLSMAKFLTASMGMESAGKQLNEKNIKKVRAVLSELTDQDLERVAYLTERYKNGG